MLRIRGLQHAKGWKCICGAAFVPVPCPLLMLHSSSGCRVPNGVHCPRLCCSNMWFLASGGSAQERAVPTTPASNWASMIDLAAGAKAQWYPMGEVL